MSLATCAEIRTNLDVLACQGAVSRCSNERLCAVFEVGLLKGQLEEHLALYVAKLTSFFKKALSFIC